MKLKELRELLAARDFWDGELEVVIPVKVAGSVAAQPYTKVKSLQAGFDWDQGKLFVYPEVNLRECDRDELKSIQKKLEDIGWNMYENRRLKAENKKLKKQIQELTNG